MNAFSAAMASIFADPNMAVDALYLPIAGMPMRVRVIRARPNEEIGFGESRIRTSTAEFDVRTADVVAPVKGDVIQIGTERFEVQGIPSTDADSLVWTLDTRPVP